MAEPYRAFELMAVVLARELRDGEVGVAPASEIATAACLLAQRTHAPNLVFLTPSGFVNPKPKALYPSASDGRYWAGCEAIGNFYDVFEYSERGVDFMFYTAMQVDRYGNLNLHWVGGPEGRRRGPGLANISHAVTAQRYFIYKTSHTRRDFPERVDFLTAPGHLSGSRHGLPGGGPCLCVTPLANMDFHEATGAMRLRSVHEGVAVEQVLANTGFPLIVPEGVSVTPPPTPEELRLLREEIDTTGLLRGL